MMTWYVTEEDIHSHYKREFWFWSDPIAEVTKMRERDKSKIYHIYELVERHNEVNHHDLIEDF